MIDPNELTYDDKNAEVLKIIESCGGYWGESKRWPRKQWVDSVNLGETLMGYWEWVYQGFYEDAI
jgi:hypothetical protein